MKNDELDSDFILSRGHTSPIHYYDRARDYFASHMAQKRRQRYSHNHAEHFLYELGDAISDWALNTRTLMDIPAWNFPELTIDGDLRKPRINLWAERTSANNLTIRWEPSGNNLTVPNRSDFRDFVYLTHDHQASFGRPENELVFIHDVDLIKIWIEQGHDEFASLIAQSIRSLYLRIGQVLQGMYEVQLLSDFESIETEKGDKAEITDWRVFWISERLKEREQFWLENFEAENGTTIDALLEKIVSTGEEYPLAADERVSKAYRKEGIRLTPGMIRQIINRLEKYHPKIYAVLVRETPVSERPGKVISFPGPKPEA